MPEMDGIKFVSAFKSEEKSKHQHIPVIAVSGNEEKSFKLNYLQYGFDYYISKPAMPDQLNYVLSHFVKNSI